MSDSKKSLLMSKLSKTTLILPSISHANLPQLTIDLILHTFPFVKVDSLDSTFLYPFASPIDHIRGQPQPQGISTPLDLYFCEELGLSLVQQRSPVIPTYQQNFHSQLIKFINDTGFDKVVLLDSKDHAFLGGFMGNCPVAVYIGTDSTDEELDLLLRQLSLADNDEEQDSPNRIVQNDKDEIKDTFTDTVAQLILSLKDSNVAVTALIGYIYEGDNTPDAKIMAGKVSKLLSLGKKGDWCLPMSWNGVYGGREVPRSMEDGMFG